jgi:hypothetical protein
MHVSQQPTYGLSTRQTGETIENVRSCRFLIGHVLDCSHLQFGRGSTVLSVVRSYVCSYFRNTIVWMNQKENGHSANHVEQSKPPTNYFETI